MSTHTPGPWRYKTDKSRGKEWFAIETDPQTAREWPIPIANAIGPCDHPEREANARLIAAAPELVAALERAVFDLVITADWAATMEDEDHAVIQGIRRDAQKANAALAKARGE